MKTKLNVFISLFMSLIFVFSLASSAFAVDDSLTTAPLYFDENGERAVELLYVRPQKNNAIIKLSGVNTIEEAEKLKGTVLYSNREDAEIEEGANYIQDIIGCYVVDYESEREYGRVVDVVNYGASDILEIENGKKRFYVPVIPDIIVETDTEYQVIRIKAMKGLFDED